MNELLQIASNYINGKPIYPPIRRVLNLLFNISIASFIYIHYYGDYSIIDLSDYKSVIRYLVDGGYAIPLSVFLVVVFLSSILGYTLFTILNHFSSIKWQRAIANYQIKRSEVIEGHQVVTKITNAVTTEDLSLEKLEELYMSIRDHIDEEKINSLNTELSEARSLTQINFTFVLRSLIAAIVFKLTQPQFGWGLFSIVIGCQLFVLIILSIAYRLLDIFPAIIRKFYLEVETYIAKNEGQTKPQLVVADSK